MSIFRKKKKEEKTERKTSGTYGVNSKHTVGVYDPINDPLLISAVIQSYSYNTPSTNEDTCATPSNDSSRSYESPSYNSSYSSSYDSSSSSSDSGSSYSSSCD